MAAETQLGFWQGLAKDLRPLANHAAVVLFLQASLLAVGLMARALRYIFPDRHTLVEHIELADTWTALAVLGMFAGYTVLSIGIRLSLALRDEFRALRVKGIRDS